MKTRKLDVIACQLGALTMAVLLTMSLGGRAAAADLVSKNPSDSMQVTIVSQKVSDDGTHCTVVLETARGIFRLKIDGAAATFKRVTFVVRNQHMWEGITLSSDKESVDLKTAKGVSVKAQDRDCLIEFDADGMALLKRGGVFQYIDAYR